jgi:hypothetical protein
MLCLSLDILVVLFQTLYADSIHDASTAMNGRMHYVLTGILFPRYMSSAKLLQLHSSATSGGISVHYLFANSQLRVLTCVAVHMLAATYYTKHCSVTSAGSSVHSLFAKPQLRLLLAATYCTKYCYMLSQHVHTPMFVIARTITRISVTAILHRLHGLKHSLPCPSLAESCMRCLICVAILDRIQ